MTSHPVSLPLRIEHLPQADSAALALLEEYYEAVHVVKRDSPAVVNTSLRAPGAGMWVAFLNERMVGCVLLRSLPSIPFAGECKRLYVQPAARGHRIADRLMDALEAFARAQGMQWIYLDSYHDLKPAIALYEKRGYLQCDRYNDNPQATVFLRKHLI